MLQQGTSVRPEFGAAIQGIFQVGRAPRVGMQGIVQEPLITGLCKSVKRGPGRDMQ